MIKINREKAEALTLDKIRAEREHYLAQLDREVMQALESGKHVASIVEQKQLAKDVTLCDLTDLSLEELGRLSLDTALNLRAEQGIKHA